VIIAVAMFKKVEVSAILGNSFLIILGYFFGQSAERCASRGAKGPELP